MEENNVYQEINEVAEDVIEAADSNMAITYVTIAGIVAIGVFASYKLTKLAYTKLIKPAFNKSEANEPVEAIIDVETVEEWFNFCKS